MQLILKKIGMGFKINLKNYNCTIKNVSDETGLISVQGPNSLSLINEVFN